MQLLLKYEIPWLAHKLFKQIIHTNYTPSSFFFYFYTYTVDLKCIYLSWVYSLSIIMHTHTNMKSLPPPPNAFSIVLMSDPVCITHSHGSRMLTNWQITFQIFCSLIIRWRKNSTNELIHNPWRHWNPGKTKKTPKKQTKKLGRYKHNFAK